MRRFKLLAVFLFIAATAIAGSPPVYRGSTGLFFLGVPPDTITPVSSSTPLPTTATIASASFTASGSLDTRITSHTAPLPAGTNYLGQVGADIATDAAAIVAAIASMSGTSTADLSALASAVASVTTAIQATPAVTIRAMHDGSTWTASVSTTVTVLSALSDRYCVLLANVSTETVWVAPFSATAVFPVLGTTDSVGVPLVQYASLYLEIEPSESIAYVSSTTASMSVTQGVR